jgi:hypothetical protein
VDAFDEEAWEDEVGWKEEEEEEEEKGMEREEPWAREAVWAAEDRSERAFWSSAVGVPRGKSKVRFSCSAFFFFHPLLPLSLPTPAHRLFHVTGLDSTIGGVTYRSWSRSKPSSPPRSIPRSRCPLPSARRHRRTRRASCRSLGSGRLWTS